MSGWSLVGLPAQFTDIFTQLAAGQSPMQILIQQGGQIKDSFGGVGNAVRALASAITPTMLAIGALGTVVGVTAAWYLVADGHEDVAAEVERRRG